MPVLAIDVGSSSVKAALLKNSRTPQFIARCTYPTLHEDGRTEVSPDAILAAIAKAVRAVPGRERADVIALSVMSPAWVAMDASGKPVTPIVTHQDRRSLVQAKQLLKDFGEARLLRLCGNLPVPGGISSTTCLWFMQHQRARMKRASLIGHLNTFLIRQFTGNRFIDPGNASFTGLYRSPTLGGWCDELIDAVGIRKHQLPEIQDGNHVAGQLTAVAARLLGLHAGMPLLTGLIDTSAAMLLAGANPGQMLDVCGTTDVLALCVDKPQVHPQLITRALGVGRRWIHASTLASAGSALTWARQTFFSEMDEKRFWTMSRKLSNSLSQTSTSSVESYSGSGEGRGPARKPSPQPSPSVLGEGDIAPASLVTFEPYLAGDRMSIEQKRASLSGLTLGTTREDILIGILRSLSRASAARIPLFQSIRKIHPRVVVSGRAGMTSLLHRDWPGKWTFQFEPEATLRGLYLLGGSI